MPVVRAQGIGIRMFGPTTPDTFIPLAECPSITASLAPGFQCATGLQQIPGQSRKVTRLAWQCTAGTRGQRVKSGLPFVPGER
jgi:hypothetical protein